MAKKETTATEIVTVAMLAEEYEVEAREIRVLLRANGMSAPEAELAEGEKFGPRKKYQWPADSKELAQVRSIIEASLQDDPEEEEAKAPTKKAPTPAKKK